MLILTPLCVKIMADEMHKNMTYNISTAWSTYLYGEQNDHQRALVHGPEQLQYEVVEREVVDLRVAPILSGSLLDVDHAKHFEEEQEQLAQRFQFRCFESGVAHAHLVCLCVVTGTA